MAAIETKDSALNPLTISAYAEIYYSYDFGKPDDGNRPWFLFSHNRHNEVNLNLGFIKTGYQTKKLRANLALAAGTYMNANLAAEPGGLKNIYEANAGFKISKKNNIWLDAGIFASHIGFESAVSKDCWMLTRSMVAESSPYYETGLKLTYVSSNEKWLIAGLLLNGWQRIQRVPGNHSPAFGHQLTYKPNEDITINSSSFIGNDKPDSLKQMRYFHDLYAIFKLTNWIALTTGFDIGAEQKYKGSRDYNTWAGPFILVKFTPAQKFNIGARLEYYSDSGGVIISTGTPSGFKTWGYSINLDYAVWDHVLVRMEGRGFTSKDAIFKKDDQAAKNNFAITSSIAVSF